MTCRNDRKMQTNVEKVKSAVEGVGGDVGNDKKGGGLGVLCVCRCQGAGKNRIADSVLFYRVAASPLPVPSGLGLVVGVHTLQKEFAVALGAVLPCGALKGDPPDRFERPAVGAAGAGGGSRGSQGVPRRPPTGLLGEHPGGGLV